MWEPEIHTPLPARFAPWRERNSPVGLAVVLVWVGRNSIVPFLFRQALMRIGLMSDTHGNIAYRDAAARSLIDRHGAEVLVHLGDTWADGGGLVPLGLPVWRVPGLYDPAYQDPRVENVLFKTLDGLRLCLVHDNATLGPDERKDVRIVACGHTHHYLCQAVGDVTVVNPGHLHSAVHRNRPPSYGVLDTFKKSYAVFGLRNELLLEQGWG